jgi:hypothetical protein
MASSPKLVWLSMPDSQWEAGLMWLNAIQAARGPGIVSKAVSGVEEEAVLSAEQPWASMEPEDHLV